MDEGPRPVGPPPSKVKRGRLSRSADFERVYRRGRSYGNRHLVLHVFPRAETPDLLDPGASPRLGLSVSRKVGGAVERNLVKRLLREAFARQSEQLPAGQDVVVVARPSALEVARRDGLGGISRALDELISQVGATGSLPSRSSPADARS